MKALFTTLLALYSLLLHSTAQANTTVPQQLVYNGHLLNSAGEALQTSHTIRFSIWSSADFIASDVSAGSINTGAATYLGWQEEHTVTPNDSGYFSLELGSVAPLFTITSLSESQLQGMFLQIEVKESTEPASAYEALDVNPANASIDRTPVLSVPFALNADYLDQREIGTGSGDIAILSEGGKFSPSVIPEETFADIFTLDSNDSSSGTITLQFGDSLAKTLSYDQINGYFIFNDDVNITGDLFVSGLINGVDITTLASTPANQLQVSSGAGLTVSVTAGDYRISGITTEYPGAGAVPVVDNTTNYLFFTATGLQVNQTGYPTNQSIIRLATVVTSGGVVTSVTDNRAYLSDDRESIVQSTLKPMYPGSSFSASGSLTTGSLRLEYDASANKNYYNWQSTKTVKNNYTVITEIVLPSEFTQFTNNALTVEYRTTSGLLPDNHIEVRALDSAGNPIVLTGSATELANTTWSQAVFSFGGSPTFTAGDSITLLLTLYSKDSNQAHVGAVTTEYSVLR